jgi:hydroxymethylglutaryl-CoA reductase (NADPH)
MSVPHHSASNYLERLLRERSQEELLALLSPRTDDPAPKIPAGQAAEAVDLRWDLLDTVGEERGQLLDEQAREQLNCYKRNIEHFIGTVKVPVGLAGPLRVNGLFARGDYYVPLATSEAALVASYSRGCQLISEVGGCTAVVLNEGISRAPGFAFTDLRECGLFINWVTAQFDEIRRCAESTSHHARLLDLRITVDGNHVYLNFEFTTGDAAGQNMVTLATEAICQYIETTSPIRPQHFFVEANLSGDKKATSQSFLSVRGKKACAEATVPADLVQRRLHTTPQRMVEYWQMCALGGVLSGALGVQGHYANGLAALYLATGQDVACVAESAVGVTRFELTANGDLYACVTLPNIVVGTVGGGTGLPSQHACLQILGLAGAGKAQALAEVCVGLCLAGELSISGALCAGDFGRAHRLLARERQSGRCATAATPAELRQAGLEKS